MLNYFVKYPISRGFEAIFLLKLCKMVYAKS